MNGQWAWAQVVMATLRDAGITRVVTSPGSRSTPLILAGQKSGLELFPVIDERSAAFFAVGCARATGSPVALLCTSGSAGAHYYPALIEAALARVPVVAITADRPPEHHGAGASQTIDQTRLFGTFTRASIDLGPPQQDRAALVGVRRRVAQAVATCREPDPGPVHINVPLTKPLEPPADNGARRQADAAAAAVLDLPITRAAHPRPLAGETAIAALIDACQRARRGVIIAGPAPAQGFRGVLDLAARTGFPLLAEATSQLRFCKTGPEVLRVDGFDLFLAAKSIRERLAPDLIVCAGAEPSSISALTYMAENLAAARVVLGGGRWVDSQNAADMILFGDAGDAAARAATHITERRVDPEWRDAFAGANARAWRAFETALGATSEAACVQAALAALGDEDLLCVGNSLPVRMIDRVRSRAEPMAVLCQRGASGIDGSISGAAGAAHASGRATMLIVGDVSFCHDVGGLAAARQVRSPLAIVVIDNGGGRIFDELPIAHTDMDRALANQWLTPPALDIAAAARSFGARTSIARSSEEVSREVKAALGEPGACVIHAMVDPTSAAGMRAMIAEELAS